MAGVIEILQKNRILFQRFPIKNSTFKPIKNEKFNDLPIGNNRNTDLSKWTNINVFYSWHD